MYSKSAAWFDALHQGKDYAGEAARVAAVVRGRQPRARTLLDVACGTGRHLEHLRDHFDCSGLDLEAGLLEVARRRLPGVPLVQADMRDFALGRRFDVVTCLFSSIGYARTVAELHAAVGCMARHLLPGGVLVVEPWILPEAWIDGISRVDVAEDDGRKVVRVSTSRREGVMTILSMHYVVAADGEMSVADERHEVRLFTRDQYLGAFAAAGLDATWDEEGLNGRGLLIASKDAVRDRWWRRRWR